MADMSLTADHPKKATIIIMPHANQESSGVTNLIKPLL